MSSDYPYGQGPSVKELLAHAEEVKAQAEGIARLLVEGFSRPKAVMGRSEWLTKSPAALPKSDIRARKRKKKLQRQARRKNR